MNTRERAEEFLGNMDDFGYCQIIRDLLAECERWKSSYENMRDFAVSSGLDIIAEDANET